jgi:hypothetical protein
MFEVKREKEEETKRLHKQRCMAQNEVKLCLHQGN